MEVLRNAIVGIVLMGASAFGYQHYKPQAPVAKPTKEVTDAFILDRIARAEPGTVDRKRWRNAIKASLRELSLPVDKKNVCSVIAIIDQESSFNANPPVEGIADIGLKALKEKVDAIPVINKKIYSYLLNTGAVNMIKSARTERDLDLVYRKIIDDIVAKFNLGGVGGYKLFASLLDGKNKITTLGAMQSKINVELERENAKTLAEIYRVRDKMYTIEGVSAGVYVLLDYRTKYSSPLYLFADYNSGQYTSRNTGFQYAVGKLSGSNVSLDGDLLRYGLNGLVTESETEKAIVTISKKYNVKLTVFSVRMDLLKEKQYSFYETEVYKVIGQLYLKQFNKQIPAEMLPDIKLDSLKVSDGFTTARFAKSVFSRYETCIK